MSLLHSTIVSRRFFPVTWPSVLHVDDVKICIHNFTEMAILLTRRNEKRKFYPKDKPPNVHFF